MKKVWIKTGAVVLLAVCLSLIITHIAMILSTGRASSVGYIIATIVPLLVATPVTFYIERQRKILADAHLELQRTNSQLQKVLAKTEYAARHDYLTGLMNREHFLTALGQCRRKSDQGAVLVLDVDHFKNVNDTYGHLVGDKALQAIVAAIVGSVRERDFVGRMGGEEFAIFLPGVGLDQVTMVAERIRASVENVRFEAADGMVHPLTLSVGGALSTGSETAIDLIHIADARMYQAKRAGRNRVVIYESNATPANVSGENSAAA